MSTARAKFCVQAIETLGENVNRLRRMSIRLEEMDGDGVTFDNGISSITRGHATLEAKFGLVICERACEIGDWQFWGDSYQVRHRRFLGPFSHIPNLA